MNDYGNDIVSFGALDAEGWLSSARRVESPNHDDRPAGEVVSLLVVHAISLPPGQFGGDEVEHFFVNALDADAHPYFSGISQLRVSAHFYIRRNGEVVQFVACCRRAWHAGVSSWNGRERCNDFSIGIELEGCDEQGFEDEQYDRLEKLIMTLRQKYPISAVVGHSEIAPGRKTDPGPFFDWRRISSVAGSNCNSMCRKFSDP